MKSLRLKKGLSQTQLAIDLGITQQTVNKYENHTTEPDIDMLVIMARYFNTSVDYLIGNTDIDRKYEVVYRSDLNDRELSLMESFRDVGEKQKTLILSLLEELSKDQSR